MTADRRGAGIARLVFSLLALGCVLWAIDVRDMFKAIVHVSPSGVALASLFLLASIASAGVVWYAVFPQSPSFELSLPYAIRHTVVGASLNALLPTSGVAGDVYRGWATTRAGATGMASTAAVVLARWCSLAGLTLSLWLVYCVMPVFGDPNASRLCLALAVVLTALSAAVTGLLLLPGLRPAGHLRIFGASVADVADFTICLARAPLRLTLAILVSMFALALEGLALFCIAEAMGTGPKAILFILLGPAIRLVHQVPGFFNALGLQEIAMLQAGAYVGVSSDVSVAISLVMHVIRVGVAIVGLPLFLTSGYVPLNEATADVTGAPSPTAMPRPVALPPARERGREGDDLDPRDVWADPPRPTDEDEAPRTRTLPR